MTEPTYADAMGDALDRLRSIGYEHGTMLVNHAPMAAEAMAAMGHTGEIAAWVDANIAHRRYKDLPTARWRLSPDEESEWRPALGDFDRVADWQAMFERELTDKPWQEVLVTWWPRLLPGMSGVMTHGVIRTAHAVRSIAQTDGDTALQRGEIARGLGYWAARYAVRDAVRGAGAEPAAAPEGSTDAAYAALDQLVLDSCDHYVQTRTGHPVPLIHAITGPAAVRLVLPYLPADQHWSSYLAARHCSFGIRGYYGPPSGVADPTAARPTPPPTAGQLVAQALELGDEHAIKLAEVAVRHHALRPDDRYARAADAATQRLRSFLRTHSFYD